MRWVLPLMLLLPMAPLAGAQAAAKEVACTDGKVKGPDSGGNCCWPNQVWSALRKTCVGIPTCPYGTQPDGESCVLSCPAGQAVSPDTQGRCCFPGQVWSSSRNVCVGIPACPSGMRPDGEGCVVACSVEGKVASPETLGNCCWPNQVWSKSRDACMGIPTCPQGMVQQGPDCFAAAPAPVPAAASAPVAIPEPIAGPAPTPAEGAPVPLDAAPVPLDAAPVPMDAAPVPMDAPVAQTGSTGAEPVSLSARAREEQQLSRSLWVLGVDFLIDMSSGRFGLRLRTDIPLYRGHWAPQLGFGAGVLPPSFIAGTPDNAWIIPLEATLGMRIPLIAPEPRVHLIPRAGVVGHLMLAPRGVDFGLKVLLGLSGRVNFGSSFGINLGFDALIPALTPGFVWLTTVGFSV